MVFSATYTTYNFIDPKHEHCTTNLPVYRRLVASSVNGTASSDTHGSHSAAASARLQLPSQNEHTRPTYNGQLYDALCRGIRMPEFERPLHVRQRYERCYFANVGNDVRATLSPARVEMVFDEPPIVLLHGVISQKEIAHIKKLASPLVSYNCFNYAMHVLQICSGPETPHSPL